MKKLYLSNTDKKIFGVCGGIAETYDIDPTIVRLVIVFLTLVTFVVPLIVTYIVAGIIMPRKNDGLIRQTGLLVGLHKILLFEPVNQFVGQFAVFSNSRMVHRLIFENKMTDIFVARLKLSNNIFPRRIKRLAVHSAIHTAPQQHNMCLRIRRSYCPHK